MPIHQCREGHQLCGACAGPEPGPAFYRADRTCLPCPQTSGSLALTIIFILLGMELFGGAFTPTTGFSLAPCVGGVCPDATLEEKPMQHFDYFGPAIISVATPAQR